VSATDHEATDDPYVITTLRNGDMLARLDELEALWLTLYDHHRQVHPGPYRPRDDSWPHRRRQYRQILSEDDGFAVLASRRANESLVGYAMVSVHEGPDDTWPTGPRFAEVETLVVTPAARGQSVGSQLLDRVDEELARLGIDVVAIGVVPGNDTALRLYERRGFHPMVTKLMRFPRDAAMP